MNSSCRHRPWVSLSTRKWNHQVDEMLSTVSFLQDVQHQKNQGVVWDIAIYWVVPLPSNAGKWRFGWEFPNLNMWCHASILQRGGITDSHLSKCQVSQWFFQIPLQSSEGHSQRRRQEISRACQVGDYFCCPALKKKKHRPSLMTKNRLLATAGARSGWWSLLLTCSWLDLFFTGFSNFGRKYCPLGLTALHFWIAY